MAYISLFKFVL